VASHHRIDLQRGLVGKKHPDLRHRDDRVRGVRRPDPCIVTRRSGCGICRMATRHKGSSAMRAAVPRPGRSAARVLFNPPRTQAGPQARTHAQACKHTQARKQAPARTHPRARTGCKHISAAAHPQVCRGRHVNYAPHGELRGYAEQRIDG
jgi:hypothetical protein